MHKNPPHRRRIWQELYFPGSLIFIVTLHLIPLPHLPSSPPFLTSLPHLSFSPPFLTSLSFFTTFLAPLLHTTPSLLIPHPSPSLPPLSHTHPHSSPPSVIYRWNDQVLPSDGGIPSAWDMGNSWLPEGRVYLSCLQPCLLFLTVDRAHYGHHSECLSTCILPFTGPLNCATGMYQRSENFRCKENFMVCINHEKTNKQTNKQTFFTMFYNG